MKLQRQDRSVQSLRKDKLVLAKTSKQMEERYQKTLVEMHSQVQVIFKEHYGKQLAEKDARIAELEKENEQLKKNKQGREELASEKTRLEGELKQQKEQLQSLQAEKAELAKNLEEVKAAVQKDQNLQLQETTIKY